MRARNVVVAVVLALFIPAPDAGTESFVFTHAPAAFSDIAGIEPLGGLNPGDDHVLAVDHMYLQYPAPPGPPLNFYPVTVMGRGSIVMVARERFDDRPDYDYSVYIRHTRAITSYVLHLHVPNANLAGILDSADPAPWIEFGSLQVLLLGQLGAPAPIPVNGGDFLGYTKNYSHAWDVGVIDSKVRGDFIGRGARRYPKIQDYMDLLGIAADPPFAGQQTLNARCFLDYLPPAVRAMYERLLTGPACGQAGWDVAGRLRGAWFNPAIDAAPTPPLGDLESGALSIVPDNHEPSTYVRIAFGAGTPLSAFDPDPGRPVTQLRQAFRVAIDPTVGTAINGDPAAVGTRSLHCYDLPYHAPDGPRYNSVRFYLETSRRLRIHYDPVPHLAPQCAVLPPELPDATWVTYVR